ncbi:hypothetical protein NDU88_007557 [Pleurodeles waltl]|uniref:Uncharacterized protein n=1 Tax=Pleurodeles waltl TaxID=8319 RepID=A0AAV7QKZ5_PLEWA|nr:hypothetical protein NDU88_007557 [Pleurodeles waltl]
MPLTHEADLLGLAPGRDKPSFRVSPPACGCVSKRRLPRRVPLLLASVACVAAGPLQRHDPVLLWAAVPQQALMRVSPLA